MSASSHDSAADRLLEEAVAIDFSQKKERKSAMF